MDENKLTLRELNAVALMRAYSDWLVALSDEAWDAYIAKPFEERLAIFRSMPFYRPL